MLQRNGLALPIGLILSLAWPASIFAQTGEDGGDQAGAEAADDDDAEVITVTGSRIQRSNSSDYATITVITPEQIRDSGAITLDQFLFRLPTVTNQGVSRFQNNGGGGAATVDLRNLGPSRTLLLVNGRRFVDFDLQSFPVNVIDRVEVLLNGASAIYGSDAIAGVINVILKSDFDGATINVFGGISDDGDGEERQVSGTWGGTWDRGDAFFHFNYLNRGRVLQRDRDWSRLPVVGFNSDPTSERFGLPSAIGSSNLVGTRLGIDLPACQLDPNAGPIIASNCLRGSGSDLNGVDFQDDPATGRSFRIQGPNQRFNYGREQFLLVNLELLQFVGRGSFDLVDASWGKVSAFGELVITARESRQRLAPALISDASGDTGLNTSNPLLPLDYREALADATINGTFDAQTGLLNGEPVNATLFLRRFTDNGIGNRRTMQDRLSLQATTGIEGSLFDDYNFELFIGGGKTRLQATQAGQINQRRAEDAFRNNGILENPANGNEVPLELFGAPGPQSPGRLSAEAASLVSFDNTSRGGGSLLNAGGSIAGPIVELPAGPLSLATGFAYREEAAFADPNTLAIIGDTAGNQAAATTGDFRVWAIFGELDVPILSGLPGVHALNARVAARYTDFSTVGAEANFSGFLSYEPFDWVRFRGGAATSFRGPTIGEAFGGAADGFPSLNDPCNGLGSGDLDPTVAANCRAQGVPDGFDQSNFGTNQIRSVGGGNPDLESETTTYYSGGVVLTAPWIRDFGIDLTLISDFYHYDVDNAIQPVQNQSILDICLSTPGLNNPLCDRIQRQPLGNVDFIDSSTANIGGFTTYGVDWQAVGTIYLEEIGLPLEDASLDISFTGNSLLFYEQTLPDGTDEELTGSVQQDEGAYFDHTWNLITTFRMGGFSFTNTLRFLDEVDDFNCLGPFEDRGPHCGVLVGDQYFEYSDPDFTGVGELASDVNDIQRGDGLVSIIESITYWDIATNYTFETSDLGDITLTAGVRNLTDQDPPYFFDSGNNASQSNYDFIGRYFFGRLTLQY